MRSGLKHSTDFKRFKSFLLKALSNNLLLAAVISAAIIFLLPPLFEKYKAEIVSKSYKDSGSSIYYADLNNDRESERILFGQFRDDYFNLIVYHEGKIIEQWNFSGSYVLTRQPVISPPGPDSVSTLYFFVYKDNKIYLFHLDPLRKKILSQYKYVIDYMQKIEGYPCTVHPLIFYDSNSDGIKEFYFALNTGYNIQPRRIFKYDPAIDTVYRSPDSYACLPYHFMIDTTANKFSIIFATNAYGNSKISDPYTDHFAWLMELDKDLDFIRKPEKIGIYSSQSGITNLREGSKNEYVLINSYEGIQKKRSTLSLLNDNLQVIRTKKFYYNPEWGNCNLYSNPGSEYFYVIREDGVIQKRNSHLELIDSTIIPRILSISYFTYDINEDGNNEIIFPGEASNQLVISRNDFNDHTSVFIPDLNNVTTSIKLDNSKPGHLIVCTKNRQTELAYGFNNLYYLRYPVYSGIYLMVFLFLSLIAKVQKHRAEIKYETEKSIAELQLKAIKNQVDPHFTLNIINSIGSLFYKQDKDKADYIFGKYSKLLRSTILNSDKIVTTLGDELEYVESYLELERYRNGYCFNWEVDFDEKADKDIQIPKMLIHTFVENAIKHGIRHLEKDGELLIGINRNEKNYHIVIKDNGIGRKRAGEIEKGNTGKGLAILDQMLELYSNLMKTKITYKINDLSADDKNGPGTEVKINIPI